MRKLRERFENPPSEYRTAPLWVWNERVSERMIKGQLQKLKEGGFGGAFIHPRPGLITEYLSNEWFYYWGYALQEAEALGMKLYIYDENSYPSGNAGGHVPSQLPDCLAQGVAIRLIDDVRQLELEYSASPLNRPGHPIKAYAYCNDDSERTQYRLLHDVTDFPAKDWHLFGDRFVVCELNEPQTNSWLAGFAYCDLLRPEVTTAFLESTYEAYKTRFGDKFGTTVPAIFTDEPEISFGKLYQFDYALLPFSYWFAAQFEQINHYDIKDYVPYLFIDAMCESLPHSPAKVRYDYYTTIHKLWVDNFIRPISEWCEKHNIAWTGHYVEHEWPYPWERTSPAVMSLYEYMQWPAIDMLGAELLQTTGTDAMMLTIREVSSVANQFRRERVLCESFGAGGWDSGIEDYRRIGDWLMVHGINFINPHVTYASIVGGRKRDHPQSFDWLQPWWPEFRQLNEYFGRMSFALSQGSSNNRVLVLHPTTGMFMQAPDPGAAKLYNPDDLQRSPELRDYTRFLQALCDGQWDYDLGDEFILERHARVDQGRLTVNMAAYDVVIVPTMMNHMKRSTLSLLEALIDAGGTVLSCGNVPEWVDGSRTVHSPELLEKFAADNCGNYAALLRRLSVIITPYLEWEGQDEAIPPGLNHLRRQLSDGSCLYFIANSSDRVVDRSFTVQGKYAEQWDGWTGETEELVGVEQNGRLQIPVRLEPKSAALFRVYTDAASYKQGVLKLSKNTGDRGITSVEILKQPVCIEGGKWKVARENLNVFFTDVCDLTVGSKQYRNVHTIHASHLAYQHHGFNMNPWDNSIQFKRRVVDRDFFDPSSGFSATFHFRIKPGFHPENLFVAVERSKYYTLVVNGSALDWAAGEWWLDEAIGVADIAGYVREGKNEVRLIASPFRADIELEPLYLRGDFSVEADDAGWVLTDPRALTTGSWVGQGLPFYSDAVLYVKKFSLPPAYGPLYVNVGKWAGTAGSLKINGQSAGLLREAEGQTIDITRYVKPGENELTIRISGSFKNLFGPHFAAGKPRKGAWPSHWKNVPKYGPQLPADYDLIDCGLFEDTKWMVAASKEDADATEGKRTWS